jgi:hypothetical protein
MFWFAPNWASTSDTEDPGTTGPGVASRLLEVGTYTSNASYGWWSLYMSSNGNNIYFSSQDAFGDESDYLSAPVTFTSNYWHLIALTWTGTNTCLYVDGVCLTNGPGISALPDSSVLSNGFAIGGDSSTGILQMHGAMNGLKSYNFPLDPGSIAAEWALISVFYTSTGQIAQAPSAPSDIPAYNVVSGPGYLLAVSTNTGCANSSNVWFAYPSGVVTNFTVNLTFTIEGGTNGLPYDVFARTLLTKRSGSGPSWTWMGQGYQCVTYTIAGLTNRDVFLILGTPQDSDNSGLTDAYQLLVTKTNPYNPWTAAGIPVAWCVLNGLNPNATNLATADPDFDGLSNLQEYLYGTNPQVSQGFSVWVSEPGGTIGIP